MILQYRSDFAKTASRHAMVSGGSATAAVVLPLFDHKKYTAVCAKQNKTVLCSPNGGHGNEINVIINEWIVGNVVTISVFHHWM